MSKKSILAITASAFGLMVACTGDPSRGGIFWSEQKAQDRVISLQNEVAVRQSALIKKQQEQNALLKRKTELQNKLASAQKRNDQEEINSLKKRIAELERQISILKG